MQRAVPVASREAMRTNASPSARSARARVPVHSRPTSLQQMYGNQRMQGLLARGVVQAKLTVNQPGDAFEREADRVADAVVRMPDSRSKAESSSIEHGAPPAIQRMCRECEDEVHRSPASDSVPEVGAKLEGQVESLGTGRPLSTPVRRFFEPRLGHDFS